MSFDPNAAMAGDLFTQADLNAQGSTELVAEGEYTLEVTGRFNKKNGGMIWVEGTIQTGPDANKKVDLFSIVLHKSPGQRGIGLQNLAALGITLDVVNGIARQVGAASGNLEPLYEALSAMLNGRVINAHLTHNTFDGKQGTTTKMQMAIGKATLVSAPQVALGGVPVAAPVAVPAPAAAPPAPAAPVAVAAPPVAAPAPTPAPEAVAPTPAPVAPAPAPAAPAVAAAPAPAAVAPVPAPAPAPAPVAAVPQVEGTVVVAPEPGF